MKYKLLLLFAIAIISATLLIGCSKTETTTPCAKCGKTATQTLSGPAHYMESEGISLNKCKEIRSGIYSAPICDSCIGPVVELETDPYRG